MSGCWVQFEGLTAADVVEAVEEARGPRARGVVGHGDGRRLTRSPVHSVGGEGAQGRTEPLVLGLGCSVLCVCVSTNRCSAVVVGAVYI